MASPTKVIIDWLDSLGWDGRQEIGYPLLAGPFVPPSPDRVVIITSAGGPGYTTEEAATDASNFQARVRGPSGDVLAAEQAAADLDLLILRAHFPVQIDGTVIVSVFRAGGGPDLLPFNPADGRYESTCNYLYVLGV